MSERDAPGPAGPGRRTGAGPGTGTPAGRPRGATGGDQGRPSVAGEAGPVLARFERPRTESETTLAVLADPHCSTRRAGTWKCFHRTEPRLAEALADCRARGVDAVVVAGDLTENGARADLERVHELLASVDVPAYAVPGNHDVPKPRTEATSLRRFERRFTPGSLPFHAAVGDLDLVGIDTASAPDGTLSDTIEGEASPDTLSWLDRGLSETGPTVVVGHHPLSPDDDPDVWRAPPVRDRAALLETLSVHDAALYVSGHRHLPRVGRAAGVREVVAPPLSSFPQGYLLVRTGPAGTVVRYVPVAGRDGLREAYMSALGDTAETRAVAETCADRLATLPLADEGDEE